MQQKKKIPDTMTSLAIVPPTKILIKRLPHVVRKQKVTFVLPDLRKNDSVLGEAGRERFYF